MRAGLPSTLLLLGLLAACSTVEKAPPPAAGRTLPSDEEPASDPVPPEPISIEPEVYDMPGWTGEVVTPPPPEPPPAENRPERSRPPGGRGREGGRGDRPDREEMMRQFDLDGDGVLSEEERAAAREARDARGGGRGGERRPRDR